MQHKLSVQEDYSRNRGLHKIKNKIHSGKIKNTLSNKSQEHYNLKLLDRWNYLKDKKLIFDAGCGSGDFMKLNPFNAKIVGRDVNKDNINKLKKQGFNVGFGDLNKDLEFSENSFDAISCFHVLEHLTNPQKAISEFYRVLKKEGVLMIMVPSFSFKNFYNDYTHVRPYTSVSLFKILEHSGFSQIQIKKGPLLESQFINALFLFFPKTRLSIEKFLGKFFPSEIFAIAKK